MRHLKRVAIALLVLGATYGGVSVNLDQSTAVSVNVQLPDCSPLTCGGGGS
ncbi:MAG TPA: hypothetical protein VGD58_08490 [Herpetosiphonaceae bacterium]